ncbi:MAG TPA: hypothetical protein PKE69_22695 [Pyrinomonadaceae bacterium]|nr:hypothetical protein [Pyrinomonadaceae bacterium]
MKFQKILLLVFVLIVFFKFCFAQETSKAILLDELSEREINCETLLVTTDYLYIELANEPNSQGYIVISGKNSEILKKTYIERVIEGAIIFRKLNKKRITIIRGKETEKMTVQVWKVPTGAEKPDFNEVKWDFRLSPDIKPFVFYANSGEFEAICSIPSSDKVYAEFLIENPKCRGHIVIYENSPAKFRKAKADLLKNFPDTIKNRLKFFFVRRETSIFELWLVPPKKK